MRAWLLLLCASESIACAAAPVPPPVPAISAPEAPPVEPSMPATPPIPADVLLQLWLPESGELYRIAQDGRFLVTAPAGLEAVTVPMSKTETGAQVVSATGLVRLGRALDSVGFFALPAEVKGTMPAVDVRLASTGRPAKAVSLVFSARRDGEAVTVRVQADPGASVTMGPLGPLYDALDQEALGGWAHE